MIGKLHQNGFTLIELLVVVAIIALLVSILVPSLQEAQELAKQTVCQTNLKGIGLAYRFYLENHDQRFFPSYWPETAKYLWCQGEAAAELLRYADSDRLESGGLLRPSFTAGGLFDCPTEPNRGPYPGIPNAENIPELSWHSFLDYSYSGWLGDGVSRTGFRATQLDNQAGLVLFYDSLAWNRRGYGFPFYTDYWNNIDYGWMSWPHSNASINMIFVDGHVENRTEDEMTDELFNPPDGEPPI